MDQNYIITIGREYGSGGHNIGRKLAERLNVPCYDKEILTAAAKKSGFAESLFKEHDETAGNSLLYSMVMGSSAYGGQPLSVTLYLEQFNTIKELAEKGACVFVGRCSDYVLRDFDNVINIFIKAPLEARIKRIRERHSILPQKAATMIEKVDKTRASYYRYYTNQKWGAAKNYHLTLDSDSIGVDGTLDMIERYLEIRSSGKRGTSVK